MNNRQKRSLDRHITGNWGEDSLPPEPQETEERPYWSITIKTPKGERRFIQVHKKHLHALWAGWKIVKREFPEGAQVTSVRQLTPLEVFVLNEGYDPPTDGGELLALALDIGYAERLGELVRTLADASRQAGHFHALYKSDPYKIHPLYQEQVIRGNEAAAELRCVLGVVVQSNRSN